MVEIEQSQEGKRGLFRRCPCRGDRGPCVSTVRRRLHEGVDTVTPPFWLVRTRHFQLARAPLSPWHQLHRSRRWRYLYRLHLRRYRLHQRLLCLLR